MPTWPEDLPQKVQQDGYTEKVPDTVLRTGMDQGASKSRRRYTAGTRKFNVTMMMTRAQVAIFDDFLDTDLEGGALSFTWIHPRTEAEATCYIVTSSVSYVPRGPHFIVAFELEIRP